MEIVENGTYLRTIGLDGVTGTIQVSHLRTRNCLSVHIRFPRVQSLPAIISRVRRLFDLGADISTIDDHLSNDPGLAALVAKRPGLRAPGAWDGFELAVRAILGQQVSVAAARRLAGQLVAKHGEQMSTEAINDPRLTHVFPDAERLASLEGIRVGMPAARCSALKEFAQAVTAEPKLLRPFGTIDEAIARLRSIRGVGDWTAQYIALRALRETDAFPATDVAILRGAAILDGKRPTAAALLMRAESWRPWRAYAAQHLWAADSNSATAALTSYA